MMNASQLNEWVITPVLRKLGLYSPSAVNLLLGTAAQESHLGTYLKQINGPALGIYQMEPATHDDIWKNYLNFRHTLSSLVLQYNQQNADALLYNLAYATALARIHYLRAPESLPQANDIEGLAAYWKAHYNTRLGKGTTDEFIDNYKRFV